MSLSAPATCPFTGVSRYPVLSSKWQSNPTCSLGDAGLRTVDHSWARIAQRRLRAKQALRIIVPVRPLHVALDTPERMPIA